MVTRRHYNIFRRRGADATPPLRKFTESGVLQKGAKGRLGGAKNAQMHFFAKKLKKFSKKVEFCVEKLIFGINLGENRKKKLLNGEKRGNGSSFSQNRGNGITPGKFQTAPI